MRGSRLLRRETGSATKNLPLSPTLSPSLKSEGEREKSGGCQFAAGDEASTHSSS